MKRALLILAASAVVALPAMADEALAKSKNCMACHAIDKKLVGPAYKDVAKKYAGDKTAADKLATKIMKDGFCLGAVGVSGVKSSEDAQIAKAGIAAIGL